MVTQNSNNYATGASGTVLTGNGVGVTPTFQTAAGNITGPGSSTNNGVVTWNGTTGTAVFSRATPLVDSSGRMTNTNQPAFNVYLAADHTNATGDNTSYTIPWDTEIFDQNNNFSGGLFTAPVTGIYQLNVTISLSNLNVGQTAGLINLITTGGNYTTGFMNYGAVAASNSFFSVSGSWLVPMTATNTATASVTVFFGTKTVTVNGAFGNCSFSGYLVA